MLVLCNECCHQRKKYQDLSSSLIPLLYPIVAGVTKPPYTRSRAPTGYAYTIGILERLILHLHGYLITGSSGTAVGGKGLILVVFTIQWLPLLHYVKGRVLEIFSCRFLILPFNFTIE